MKSNQVALDIVYSASAMQKSRYPVNYMDGPIMKLPHLAELKHFGQLLDYQALLRTESGDAEGAVKAVKASFHTARSLDNEPVLISQLVAASILSTSCKSLERVVGRLSLSDELLSKLATDISSVEATNRILTGLIGERAIYGEFLRLAQDDVRQMIRISNKGATEDDQTKAPSRDPGVGWHFLGLAERERNFYLRAMETNILINSVLPPDSLSMGREAVKLENQARRGLYIFSGMILPGVDGVAKRTASLCATLRTALAAVAIERWRISHNGNIPESLDQLVPSFLPSVPLDPFTGRPAALQERRQRLRRLQCRRRWT